MHGSLAAGFALLLTGLLTQQIPADASSLSGSDNQDGRQAHAHRLEASESAYLRQHADNPIDWYPWADEAFAKARGENKLIFLSIGYASCHWCHVMELESFLDPEVASLLNQSFVSIKVDREQLPDIDAHYSRAVEAIKGESGWPITIVLLPDRAPVFAANYLGKEQLLTAFTRLSQDWLSQPEGLRGRAALLAMAIDDYPSASSGGKAQPLESWAEEASQRLLSQVDSVYGGFGQTVKFPQESRLQFLLNRYKLTSDPRTREVLVNQLDAIMNKGMADIVFGGVFRYTTDREMTRPHFEKMLYNQALSAYLFADAASWLQRTDYKNFADAIVHFAQSFLRLEDGTYAAAIDADHSGREGGYYLWPEHVVRDVPRELHHSRFENDQSYLFGAFSLREADWLDDLRQFRTEMPRRIDNRVTAWNALWISALLKAACDVEARVLAETVWQIAWVGGELMRMGTQTGFLDDYAYLSVAYWQLYLATMDSDWKQRARLLDRRMLDLFFQDGSLAYRSKNQADQFSIDLFLDRELPSPAAAVLDAFAKHQTESEFIAAYEAIKRQAAAQIGSSPERYLTLIAAAGKAPAADSRIIARGHGMVSLRSAEKPGIWKLIIDLDEDWHVNAAEVFDQNLVPTKVLDADEVLAVHYPNGSELTVDFSEAVLNVYSGRVQIEIETEANAPELDLSIKLQACSSEVCLLPESHELRAVARHR